MWACVEQGDLSRVYACVYNNRHGVGETIRFFEHLQRAAYKVLERYPSAELVVLGDFNGHHTEWLGSSRPTNSAGWAAYEFALVNGLTQLVSEPTYIPDIVDRDPSLLDLLLTSHPDGYEVSVDAPLG